MAPGLGHRGLGDARSLKFRGPGHTARGLVDEPGGKVGARSFSERLRRKRSGRGPDVGLVPGLGHRGLGDARSLKLRGPGHTARGLVDEPGGKVGARSFSKRMRRKGAGAGRRTGTGAWAPRPRRRSLAEASRSGAHRARFGGRAGGKVGARSFSKRLRRKGAGGGRTLEWHRGLGTAASATLAR
jgi:hypothetical protein